MAKTGLLNGDYKKIDEVPDYQDKIDSEGLHDSKDKAIVAIEDPEVEASIKYLLKT